jgi:phosphodiesterase/alkaline phosphatase D-like protein
MKELLSGKNILKYEDQVIKFDKPNPKDFTFAAVSCQHTLSSSEVYQHVKNHEPGMVLMLGDFHYAGHSYMSTEQFKFGVHEVMKSE